MSYPPPGQPPYGGASSPGGQPPAYGQPGPGVGPLQPPVKVTATWVNVLAASIVTAAVVACILIFALRDSGSGKQVADATPTQSAKTSAPPSGNGQSAGATKSVPPLSDASQGKPAKADVNKGIVKILKAGTTAGKFTDEQIQKIADCATPQLMSTMSKETLKNYVAGKDLVTTEEENAQVKQIVADCTKGVTGG